MIVMKSNMLKTLLLSCALLLICWNTKTTGQDTVIYTVTGNVGDGLMFGLPLGITPFESYVAEFVIDTTVQDVELESKDLGTYPGAVLSGGVVFSGGLDFPLDFSDGSIQILVDKSDSNDLSAIFIRPNIEISDSLIAVFALELFESDALLTDPATQIMNQAVGLSFLNGDGIAIRILDDIEFEVPTFTVSLPSISGDINADGVVDLLDVEPFVNILLGVAETNLAADINEDGVVDLTDVAPFVQLVLGG